MHMTAPGRLVSNTDANGSQLTLLCSASLKAQHVVQMAFHIMTILLSGMTILLSVMTIPLSGMV